MVAFEDWDPTTAAFRCVLDGRESLLSGRGKEFTVHDEPDRVQHDDDRGRLMHLEGQIVVLQRCLAVRDEMCDVLQDSVGRLAGTIAGLQAQVAALEDAIATKDMARNSH